MSKLKFHNKIATILSTGNVVTIDEIKMCFANDEHATKLLYRLSTYIYDIKKYENGIVKVFKNGRNITGYQLMNADCFDSEGRNANMKLSKTAYVKQVVENTQDEQIIEQEAA